MCEKLNRLRKSRDDAYVEVSALESYLRDVAAGRKPLPDDGTTRPISEEIARTHEAIEQIDAEILKLL